METILIPDRDDRGGSTACNMKIVRKWNQLSRLQRSLLFFSLCVIAILVMTLYTTPSKVDTRAEVPQASKLIQKVDIKQEKNSKLLEKIKLAARVGEVRENEGIGQHLKIRFKGPTNDRMKAVVESFKHAWNGYRTHAWGFDFLKPTSGTGTDWFSLGLTIVDSIDTAYIMGLTKEFEEGKRWISSELKFTNNKKVNLFEVTIRVLGGLLTNYHFTKDEIFLTKAEELGNRLMPAFSSPSGIPYSDVNLGKGTAHTPEWSLYSSLAEVATIQLEFRELSRITNNPVFKDAVAKVSEKIHEMPKKHGLLQIYLSPNTGKIVPHAGITLGARGDSYYEYLLKQWLQTGKTINYLLDDYMAAIDGVREVLAKRTSPNKYLFVGELTSGSEAFDPKMDHLTCFLPGTLALGHANGLPDWHLAMAEDLLHTCYMTYATQPTFLAPEITHFNMEGDNDMFTKPADTHNLLRPEFIESLWYMYQLTGNTTYQDWGWRIYQEAVCLDEGVAHIMNLVQQQLPSCCSKYW